MTQYYEVTLPEAQAQRVVPPDEIGVHHVITTYAQVTKLKPTAKVVVMTADVLERVNHWSNALYYNTSLVRSITDRIALTCLPDTRVEANDLKLLPPIWWNGQLHNKVNLGRIAKRSPWIDDIHDRLAAELTEATQPYEASHYLKVETAYNAIHTAFLEADGGSCMRYETAHFGQRHTLHPAAAAIASDLPDAASDFDMVVCYRKDNDKPVGRAYLLRDTKLHGRVFGREPTAFRSLLKNEGYSLADDSEFNGKAINYRETDCGHQIAPYVDRPSGEGSVYAVRDDNKWVLQREWVDHYSVKLDAYGNCMPDFDDETAVCDNCEEPVDQDETTTVASGDVVCDYCLQDAFTYVEGHHEYYPNDEVVTCDYSDEQILEADSVTTECGDVIGDNVADIRYSPYHEVTEGSNTGIWHEQYLVYSEHEGEYLHQDDARQCADSDEWYLDSDDFDDNGRHESSSAYNEEEEEA